MLSVTFTPGINIALERSKCSNSAREIVGESKYFGSGHIRIVEPVSLTAHLPVTANGSTTSPSANTIRWFLPSRLTSTSSREDSALVTETPTPCSPPVNL